MTFANTPEIELPAKSDVENVSAGLQDVKRLVNGHTISGKVILPPFEPVIFVEAKETNLNAELDGVKYKPINVPGEQTPAQPVVSTCSI